MIFQDKVYTIIVFSIVGLLILIGGCVSTSKTAQPNYEITDLKCVPGSSLQNEYGYTAVEGVIQNNGSKTIDSLTLRLSLYNKDNARVDVGGGFPTIKNIRPNEKIHFSGSIMSYENSNDCLNGNAYVIARYYPGFEHGSGFASTKPTHGNIEVYNTKCVIGRYDPQLRSYVKNLDSGTHDTIVVKYYIFDDNNTRIGEARGDINHIYGGEIVQVAASLNQNIYDKCQKGNLTFEIQTFQYM